MKIIDKIKNKFKRNKGYITVNDGKTITKSEIKKCEYNDETHTIKINTGKEISKKEREGIELPLIKRLNCRNCGFSIPIRIHKNSDIKQICPMCGHEMNDIFN